MKKTIEMLMNEKYYAPLYELIEDELEIIRKTNRWFTMTDKRYEEAMKEIAHEWNVDVNELRAYYEN